MPYRNRRIILVVACLSLFIVALAGCGMEAKVGAASAYTAATDYVSALADRDYDRVRGLRDPQQFKQIAFDNNYFDDERAQVSINDANPSFSDPSITDANGQSIAINSPVTTISATVQLQVVGGPKLRLIATNRSQVWYVSDIQKQ